jgi:hypothetical protein
MTNETNKPVVSNRDKLLSCSVFPQTITDAEGNNRTAYSISLQRAYQTKEQKGTNNYERQKISMYPEEALRFAELLRQTYHDLLVFAQMNKSQSTGNYPAATMDVADAPEPVSDDIPF